jgi:hypothetical protein
LIFKLPPINVSGPGCFILQSILPDTPQVLDRDNFTNARIRKLLVRYENFGNRQIRTSFLSQHAYGERPVQGRDANMKTKKAKAARKTKKITKQSHAVRSKAARSNIAEGTRLFAVAGRPTKAHFIKVYGPSGPKMTWEQRAKAGVDAKHFQEALKAKA